MNEASVFGKYFRDQGKEVMRLAETLLEAVEKGDSCILLEDCFSLPEIVKIRASDVVGHTDGDQKPFIITNEKAYLTRFFKYETSIVDFIKSRSKIDCDDNRLRFLSTNKELLEQLFGVNQAIDWQFVACVCSFINDFSLITGGPGTGKTTTVAKLLVLLFSENRDLRVGLVAPTGKAAARLSESIKKSKELLHFVSADILTAIEGITTSTIHRLLGYKMNDISFHHTAKNKLNYDVLIVDESSMIDLPLMSKLISAIAPTTKVILMGDKKQLASVEVGSVFGDLCDSQLEVNTFSQDLVNFLDVLRGYKLPLEPTSKVLSNQVVELQKSWRFNDHKGLGKFSKEILEGSIDCMAYRKPEGDEYVIIENQGYSELFYSYLSQYRHYIFESSIEKALIKLDVLRVLSATKGGDYGVENLNTVTELFLQKKYGLRPKAGFYHNQPIMITQNNKGLNLYNGDVGLVRENAAQELTAYFMIGAELREIPVGLIKEYQTVFAMTIHKSQGSEFENIIVFLSESGHKMDVSKELFYTGVTRAKKQVLLIASDNAVESALSNSSIRTSGISDRLAS